MPILLFWKIRELLLKQAAYFKEDMFKGDIELNFVMFTIKKCHTHVKNFN